MAKQVGLLLSILLLTGCQTSRISEDSVAGGGCDRKTTWSLGFEIIGISANLNIGAKCETIKADGD